MMTLETMQAVAEELNRRGVPATVEYPGYLQVQIAESFWLQGGSVPNDEDGTFDLDVVQGEEHNVIETIGSTLPDDSTDVKTIADHIACTYTEGAIIQSDLNA